MGMNFGYENIMVQLRCVVIPLGYKKDIWHGKVAAYLGL